MRHLRNLCRYLNRILRNSSYNNYHGFREPIEVHEAHATQLLTNPFEQ